MIRRWPFWLALLVLALVAIYVVAQCTRRPETWVTNPPVVVVPDREVTKDRPTTKPPTIGQRVVTRPVAVIREVSAGVPDTARVRAFARAVFVAESLRAVIRQLRARGDDSTVIETPPPILPPTSGRYDGKRLTLWLSRSDGSVMKATARLRPRWSFVAGAGGRSDSIPLVREDRWWVRQAREVPGCLPAAVVGGGAGVLLAKNDLSGLGLGAVVGLAACLSD